MSSKTKIVVLRMKEIIYTAIFIGFGILLVMLLFIMFHLVQPSLEHLTGQICSSQSLENLSYPEETRYTSQVLIRAIESALEKARVK